MQKRLLNTGGLYDRFDCTLLDNFIEIMGSEVSILIYCPASLTICQIDNKDIVLSPRGGSNFYKGDNFCEFLFAILHTKSI